MKDVSIADLAVLGSISVISFGVWQIFQPAAFIVGGCLILWLTLTASRKAPRK
jgi:hypothetical protein